jgi:hypothetical protein
MKRRPLNLEVLEDRTVPSTLSAVWPDPGHLTLSFAPDGTNASTGPSNLFAVLNAQAPTAAWEQTILRAFQTWADQANINIGVVGDNGVALGSPGLVQGGSGFGDIRIAGRPLASTALATTAYYQPGNTWSGDMILNTNYSFGNGPGQYDLYSVVLHEAGLAFGLRDGTDPSSVMYNRYQGTYTGLGSNDVQALQALYGGPRSPDAYGGPNGANSLTRAADLHLPGGADPSTPLTVTADITTHSTVDFFKFQIGGTHAGGIDVRVQTSGISLLTPHLTVFDGAGNVVASTASTDPLNGNLLIHLDQVIANATFYAKVEGARSDVFGIGSYQLAINLHPQGISAGQYAVANSIDLHQLGGPGAAPLTANGIISPSNTAPVYKFQTQNGDYSAGVNVAVRSWGVSTAAPTLTVYDASANVLATIAASDPAGGLLSLHINNVATNSTYYAKLTSAVYHAYGFGAYALSVNTGPASAVPAPSRLLVSQPQPINTIDHAANLNTLAGYAQQTKYATVGSLNGAVDYYHIKSANVGTNQTTTMTVTVIAQGGSGLAPVISVYDEFKNAVAATVLTNGTGTFSIQIAGVLSDKDLFLGIGAGAGKSLAGNYYLDADFYSGPAQTLQALASGQLTQSAPQQGQIFMAAQNGLFSFVLSAQTGPSAGAAQVQMRIFDQAGHLIYMQIANAGQPPSSGTVYLTAGDYHVQFAALAPAPGSLPVVVFHLSGMVLTNPIGPYVLDPTASTSGGSSAIVPPPSDPNAPASPYLSNYLSAWSTYLGAGNTTPGASGWVATPLYFQAPIDPSSLAYVY